MARPLREIGRRIRQVREETGITDLELAGALGLDQAWVAALEAGGIDPLPGDYVLIAARVLNTDFRYFISDQLDDVEDIHNAVSKRLISHAETAQNRVAEGGCRWILRLHSNFCVTMKMRSSRRGGEMAASSCRQ